MCWHIYSKYGHMSSMYCQINLIYGHIYVSLSLSLSLNIYIYIHIYIYIVIPYVKIAILHTENQTSRPAATRPADQLQPADQPTS